MATLNRSMRRVPADAWMIVLHLLLWLMFFWRLFTPFVEDQASFKQGDFSGQFVAFGAYQYERLTAGEIPLWNPYNNGGMPFIADTQAAVFYPPRWLTIVTAYHTGGWSYAALQTEAALHVLLYALLMYAFVRRLTWGHSGSLYAALVASIVAAYGGFIGGYPPLQLALLESGIWLPLMALGILEATRQARLAWGWLAVAGLALGLAWMAGHPQTAWFLTYLGAAWYAYRAYIQKIAWRQAVLGFVLFGVIAIGITAVTLLPGVEYLRLTARAEMGYDAKRNGFPLQDVWQMLFPGTVSLFSPLYMGIPALLFAYTAIRQRVETAIFWAGVALVALLHSFGGNMGLFPALYNILPGLRFFRGQERAAVLVSNSLAILAGLGAARLATLFDETRAITKNAAAAIGLLTGGIALLAFLAWQFQIGEQSAKLASIALLSAASAGGMWLLMKGRADKRFIFAGVVSLIVLELFSVTRDTPSNYDPVPAVQQIPALSAAVEIVMADNSSPYRVDGFRGLEANYGTLYQVADIRGISPLFFTPARDLIYRDYIHNPLAWELFAVKYVFSERDSFRVPSEIIAEGTDSQGVYKLHRLTDPRPFALLMYKADVVDSDAFANALLNDSHYDPRTSIIVQGEPDSPLPDEPGQGTATVTNYQPESFTIDVTTNENAILSLAQIYYPGWRATLDDVPVPLLRAYGSLTAIAVPEGDHTIRLVYDPTSYKIGFVMSAITWGILALWSILTVIRKR
jgi:hypothetical protein